MTEPTAGQAALAVVERARKAQAAAIAAGAVPAPAPEPEHVEPWRDTWQRVVPRRYSTARLADLPGPAAAKLHAWAGQDTPAELNVVLGGPVGVGKTHAAVALATAWAEQHHRAPAFWPVVELLDAMRPGGDDTTLGRLKACPLLVLDDVGAERVTDWALERLYLLVNRRWLDELPTIATTNLGSKALADAVGERIASRLTGGALALALGGADRRKVTR